MHFERPSANKQEEPLKSYERFEEFKEQTGLDISYVEDDERGIVTVAMHQKLGPREGRDVSSKATEVEIPITQKQQAAALYKEACEKLKDSTKFKKEFIVAAMNGFFESRQKYPTNPETEKPFTKEEVEAMRKHFYNLGKENHLELTMLVVGLKEVAESLDNPETRTEAVEKLKDNVAYAKYPSEDVLKLFRLVSNLAQDEKDRLDYARRGQISQR
jgi:hypothetical protein